MLQAQYAADAQSWSDEQAALQADLASLAAQTALKSLALDAMLRAGGTAGFAPAGHAVDGPLWQQVKYLSSSSVYDFLQQPTVACIKLEHHHLHFQQEAAAIPAKHCTGQHSSAQHNIAQHSRSH